MVGTMWQDYETDAYGVFGNHVADSLVAGKLYKNGQVITSFNQETATRPPTVQEHVC